MHPPTSGTPAPSGSAPWLAFLYSVLIVYGTLYPFTGWREPEYAVSRLLYWSLFSRTSRADMVVNVLAYVPLGLALALAWRARASTLAQIAFAGTAGFCLSLALETTQAFLPGRTPSLIDLLLNTGGSGVGAALLHLVSPHTGLGRRVRALRAGIIRPGPHALLGLVVLGLWALSQLSPFVPSIDIGNLRHGLSPVYHSLLAPRTLNLGQLCAYALAVAALGLIAYTLVDPALGRRGAWLRFGAFVGGVLLLKVPIVTRQLSLEALLGALLALALLVLVARQSVPRLRLYAVAVTPLFCAVEELRPAGGVGTTVYPFSWHLFEAHMLNVHGLADILATVWPAVALAFLVMPITAGTRHAVIWVGAVLIGAAAFGLEWLQQYTPGRRGEITDSLLPVAGWLVPWFTSAAKTRWHSAAAGAVPG
jgi:VanZ family protein